MAKFAAMTEDVGGVVVARLQGSLDLAAISDLERLVNRLSAQRPARLVLDLQGVDFLASLGVGQLVTLHHAVKAASGRMTLAGAGPDVGRVLQRCRVDTLIPMVATVEAAMA